MSDFYEQESSTSQINYRYYTDFEPWSNKQKAISGVSALIGAVGPAIYAIKADVPYINQQVSIQTVQGDIEIRQGNEIDNPADKKLEVQQIKSDKKTISHLESQKFNNITAMQSLEMSGAGALLSALVIGGVSVAARYKMHQRRKQRINEYSTFWRLAMEYDPRDFIYYRSRRLRNNQIVDDESN